MPKNDGETTEKEEGDQLTSCKVERSLLVAVDLSRFLGHAPLFLKSILVPYLTKPLIMTGLIQANTTLGRQNS